MMKRTAVSRALLIAFGGTAVVGVAPVGAQEAAPVQQLERVEVTGSAIKRIDAETSVPVTVLRADDLRKQGVSTVEGVLNMIGGNQTTQTTSQSVGASTGGAAFANLRGLGQNKTLVLLNGRRIANNAFDGSAPDLNMIPFAALDRVEVLRDGASALYGTDAIGGVINFITRKDLRGGSITLGADIPQHSGGQQQTANVGAGFGDLTTDRYNVVGFLDFQKQDAIHASQRAFGSTGLIPDKGVSKSSGTPSPANYGYTTTTGASATANPSNPNCDAPNGFASGTRCRYDYTRFVDLVPDSERMSGMLKGTFAAAPTLNLNAEYFYSTTTVRPRVAPEPHTELTMDPGTQFYPGGGITPGPTGAAIDSTKPITVQWRTTPTGARSEKDVNTQQRFVLSADGSAVGWDYDAGASYNLNSVHQMLTGGYNNRNILDPAVETGVINPFGAQTAAGQAVLDSAAATGNLLWGRAEVWQFDSHASREVGDWLGAGRAAALAVGVEARHEKSAFYAKDPTFADEVVASTGVDPGTNSRGSRSVFAGYTELNLPLMKTLDVTASARYDKYSDFGSTLNTKGSFRFQPVREVLVRGSVGTGFRAPSLYDLHAATTYTNTANTWNDPKAGCDANGNATTPGFASTACGTQFLAKGGGNTALQPEKSHNYTLGLVLEPLQNLTVGIDLWMIHLRQQIGVLPDTTIFGDPTKYANLFVRNAAGQLSTSGTECPAVATCGYVIDTSVNLGKVNTNGIDLSAAYRLRSADYGTFNFALNGTYVHKYDYQTEEGGPYIRGVNAYTPGAISGGGPIFRWQHSLAVQWTSGPFGAGVVNRFKTGYTDQNDVNQVDACCLGHHVRAYSLWDLNGSYAFSSAFTLTAGIRNVFDTDPPFSNQGATFQVGYDPRFTDPTGRSFFLRGTYSF